MMARASPRKPDWVLRAIDASILAAVGGALSLYLAHETVAWFLIGVSGGSMMMRKAHRSSPPDVTLH